MRRFIVLVGFGLLGVLLLSNGSRAEDGILAIYVSNTNEEPMPGAILSPRGAGSVSPPTDSSGRTRIKLSRGAQPGKFVTLQLIKGPGGASGWYLVSPWKGRASVPSFVDDPDNYLQVIVARKQDKLVLKNANALLNITIGVLQAEASMLVSVTSPNNHRRDALALQSEITGLEPSAIDQEIRASLGKSKDPYERGLMALYNGMPAEAALELTRYLESSKPTAKFANAAFFLGQANLATGKFDDAAKAYEKALSITPNDVLTLYATGLAYQRAGREEQAEINFYTALSKVPTDELNRSQLLTNLGKIYDVKKRPEIIERYYGVAEASAQQEFLSLTLLPEEAMAGLGFFNEGHGFYKNRISDFEQNLAQSMKSGDKAREAESLVELGARYYWKNNPKQALELYERAEPMIASLKDPTKELGRNLGMAASYKALQQYDKALVYYIRAMAIIETLDNPGLEQFVLEGIGQSHLGLKQNDRALQFFEQAVAKVKENLGEDDPAMVVPLFGLAEAHNRSGRYSEVVKSLQKILVIREKFLGPDNRHVATLLWHLGEVNRKQKEYKEAELQYKKALTVIAKNPSPYHRASRSRVLARLASLYDEQNRFAEAEATLKESVQTFEQHPTDPDRAIAMANLARFYAKQERNQEAGRLFGEAAEIIEKSASKEPEHLQILKDYAAFRAKNN